MREREKEKEKEKAKEREIRLWKRRYYWIEER